jgi:predicted MFS family arabinose efflux permease
MLAPFAPLIVPFIALHFGWRSSFLAIGGLDVIWLVLWLTTYRDLHSHKWLGSVALVGPPLIAIYVTADGLLHWGWLSSTLLAHGMD